MEIPDELWRALDIQVFFTIPQTAELLQCDERTVRKSIAAWNAGDNTGIPSTRLGVSYRVPTSWLRALARPVPHGPCALCGTEGPRISDRCRRHNEVRGTLCPRCNVSEEPPPLWYEGNCPGCQPRIRAEIRQFERRHPESQAVAQEPSGMIGIDQ